MRCVYRRDVGMRGRSFTLRVRIGVMVFSQQLRLYQPYKQVSCAEKEERARDEI